MTEHAIESRQSESHDRGRHAERPRDIPKKGWRDIMFRVKNELSDDNVSLLAAGVAFYALMAVFPGVAALISIYGLVADPGDVAEQIILLNGIMPEEALAIFDEQMHSIASQSDTALSLGVAFSILIALWSANKGILSLISALNIVYDEDEKRGLIKLYATALALTTGALLLVLVTLGLIVALPALLDALGLHSDLQTLLASLRWPLLLIIMMCALTVVYRIGPSRSNPRWQWISWGSVIATLLWLIGSGLFSFYVSNFGSYNETYGSVGAVVILLMWFYLSSYIVLLGAEFNAEVEHQTQKDSTVGGNQPQGERGAHVADTVGEPAD